MTISSEGTRVIVTIVTILREKNPTYDTTRWSYDPALSILPLPTTGCRVKDPPTTMAANRIALSTMMIWRDERLGWVAI